MEMTQKFYYKGECLISETNPACYATFIRGYSDKSVYFVNYYKKKHKNGIVEVYIKESKQTNLYYAWILPFLKVYHTKREGQHELVFVMDEYENIAELYYEMQLIRHPIRDMQPRMAEFIIQLSSILEMGMLETLSLGYYYCVENLHHNLFYPIIEKNVIKLPNHEKTIKNFKKYNGSSLESNTMNQIAVDHIKTLKLPVLNHRQDRLSYKGLTDNDKIYEKIAESLHSWRKSLSS